MTISGPGANVLTVRRNTGGNYRIFTIPSGNVTIDGLTISNGNVVGLPSDGGGGIFNNSSGIVNVTNSTISGNSAVEGGAIRNNSTATLNISNSTISGNSATAGSIRLNTAVSVNITNSTISGNTSTGNGGGIDINSGTLTITHSTITNNRADNDNNATGTGGGIFRIGGTATLRNTIVARNLRGNVVQVETATVAGTITAAGNAKVVVTAIGMGNSPKTVNVVVAAGDTASVVAGKMRTALGLDADVSAFFTISGAGANVVLTVNTAAANDATMNIATDNSGGPGSSAGLTNTPTSANTTAGATADDISGTMDAASSFNLIGTGGAGGLVNNVNANQVGVADPGLFALAANGGQP